MFTCLVVFGPTLLLAAGLAVGYAADCYLTNRRNPSDRS